MRMISVRLKPVARILSVIYALLSVVGFLQFAFGGNDHLTLPFGIVAPLFYLNFNLNLPRSTDIAYNMGCFLSYIVAYAITGWITGAAAVISFNFVAEKMGGIDAKFITTINDEKSEE